jgi:hypothetical protein
VVSKNATAAALEVSLLAVRFCVIDSREKAVRGPLVTGERGDKSAAGVLRDSCVPAGSGADGSGGKVKDVRALPPIAFVAK